MKANCDFGRGVGAAGVVAGSGVRAGCGGGVGLLGWRLVGGWVLAMVLGGCVMGCRTAGSVAAVDLGGEGWRVRQGQAVWRVGEAGPELAGDLLLATHVDGRVWLEFMKSPVSLVRCRVDGAGWEAEFPARGRRVGGRGRGWDGVGWLVLADCVGGKGAPGGWVFERRADLGWRLVGAGTGEAIEGFLAP